MKPPPQDAETVNSKETETKKCPQISLHTKIGNSMAILPTFSSNNPTPFLSSNIRKSPFSPLFPNPGTPFHQFNSSKQLNCSVKSYRITTRGRFIEEDEDDEECCSFGEAVALFNSGDYYRCHDVLETLWNKSQEPLRTLFHAILQCAVGFHHLFNQNHRGAMMELGEGLCKLRKLNFESGPFHQFEKEITAVLEFIYQTQLENAACTEELCLAMDQSERSYQLLGRFGAGQRLYCLDRMNEYILFCPERYNDSSIEQQHRIKVPVLNASEQHLIDLEYN